MSIGYKASKQSAGKRLSTSLSTWTAVDAGGGTLPTGGSYTRPADWLALPDVGTTQQFVGLYAIFTQQNLLAIRVQGNYTVDWGDGVIENYNSSVTAYHSYNYSAINANTLSSRGYKQVIVKITPQAGYNITELNFQRMYTGQLVAGMSYPWLEMTAYTPYLTALLVGAVNTDSNNYNDPNIGMQYLEMVDFRSTAITEATSAFANCTSLQVVKNMAGNFQYTPYMFYNCAIKSVPALSMSNCSDARFMFANSKLETFPTMTLTNLQSATGMFSNTNIVTVPNLTLTNCYNTQYMFAECDSLRTVGNVTIKGGVYVPAQGGLVRYLEYMFKNSRLLSSVGTMDILSNTTLLQMGSCFENCGIVKVPSVTNMDSNNPSVFEYSFISAFNLIDVSNILGVGASINFSNTKLSSASLNLVYGLLNTSAASRTINVSNCIGAAGSNKTIATNRGWTVIG